MTKSYSPLRPKPQRKPPTWLPKATRFMVLSTDDTEFSVCHVAADTGRLRRVAYRNGRGQWLEVTVDFRRVKEAA